MCVCVCLCVRTCVCVKGIGLLVLMATDDTTTNDAIGYCHGVGVSNIICNDEIYGHHTPNLYLEYCNTKKCVSNSILKMKRKTTTTLLILFCVLVLIIVLFTFCYAQETLGSLDAFIAFFWRSKDESLGSVEASG